MYTRAKRNGPFVLCDGITITMNDLSQTVSGSEETVSSTRLAADLVDLFNESITHCFIALLHDIVDVGKENAPDSEVRLTIVKS